MVCFTSTNDSTFLHSIFSRVTFEKLAASKFICTTNNVLLLNFLLHDDSLCGLFRLLREVILAKLLGLDNSKVTFTAFRVKPTLYIPKRLSDNLTLKELDPEINE